MGLRFSALASVGPAGKCRPIWRFHERTEKKKPGRARTPAGLPNIKDKTTWIASGFGGLGLRSAYPCRHSHHKSGPGSFKAIPWSGAFYHARSLIRQRR